VAVLKQPHNQYEHLMLNAVIQRPWRTCYFVLLGEANEEGKILSTTEAAMPNPEVKAPEAQEEEGAATSIAEARPEEEEGVQASMTGPKAAEEEDAESSAKAEEEEDEVFVVVGTGEGVKASSWSPCKGRLLLIQLAKSGSAQKGSPGSNGISSNMCHLSSVLIH